ncbi:thionin-like [Raphanus sativus]|uniref:Thionin-like n=1 Tax=Raphanus sativus TaxID=3726 RepID=A0A6J0MT00_RAPSA|nr:thionin-like [Raphanus sativus]
MEGKTVILSVLIMSFVMAHNQVEAKVCCPTKEAKLAFYQCYLSGMRVTCAKKCGCIIAGETCPPGYPYGTPGYPYGTFGNSGDIVNEYCKLGCASSVCGALTTLQDSDASEIVNGAVEQCTNACANFCTKGSANSVETA